MKKHTLYILLVFFGTLVSCISRKPLAESTTSSVSEETDLSGSAAAMMDKVHATQVPYIWFAASGQGKIDWDGQRLSARINVRILHDSIIWVQIQKLGFEVGRMLITPDSAFFINRFERTYSRYGTEEFLSEYRVPADFEMFSSVFTAGAYMPPGIRRSVMEPDGSIVLHSGDGMSARHWFDASALLVRSLIIDQMAREWYAVYADYKWTSSGRQLPYRRSNTVIIDGKPNIFDLEYDELEIDVPQEFPFLIPSHYEKI